MAATATLLPEGRQSFTDDNGAPLVGGTLETFAAGTSTPKITWADAAKITENPTTITLDARGEATIFWDGAYKVTLRDATGALIYTVDNVTTSTGLYDYGTWGGAFVDYGTWSYA